MIANMTYPAMPLCTIPVHVSKTFFQSCAYWATPLRRAAEVALDFVLLHGAADEVERLMIERALSINTAAASGNTSLISIG